VAAVFVLQLVLLQLAETVGPPHYAYGSDLLSERRAACCRQIRHRGIGLPLTTGKAEAGTLPSVVEGL